MKLWNPPKDLKDLRKRASLYLLVINVIVATTNLVMLSSRNEPRTMVCRIATFTTSVCVEQ